MEAIELACWMERITKNLKIELDSDLVGKIYDIYKISYENYTLLELIGLLRKRKIAIDCPWSKKDIIQMISDKNIKLPIKEEPLQPTKWEHYRIRRSLDIIKTDHMEFYEGSIIQMPDDGDPYLIIDVESNQELISEDLAEDDDRNYKDVLYVYLENTNTKKEYCIYVEDLMYSLDYEDVTILQDRNRGMFMNEEQKIRWTNHIRYI